MSTPSSPLPAVLPAVPAKIHPPQQPGRPGLPRPAGASIVKTAFDAAPANTLAVRQAAERARTNLQAAVRAVANAQHAVDELAKLTGTDAVAATIAEHEGVGPAVTEKFTKLAAPLVAAFTVAPPPAA